MARAKQGDIEEIDLEALRWERVPNGPAFSPEDVVVLAAGISLYVKHLEAMAVEAQKLGRESDAGRAQRDATALMHELVGDRTADPPVLGRLYQRPPLVLPGHMKPLEKGTEFYVKNLRAAKGTVRGLGKLELSDDFEVEATEVEERLLPMFQEQGSLPLQKPAPVENLKALAETEAEIEERKQEAEPHGGAEKNGLKVHRGGKGRRKVAKV